ncbi:MAG: exodeoxyribonuclease I, partial [Rhodoferax sp.]|nr:exodeoxyribonuclease I [Rhodoferax sp.]
RRLDELVFRYRARNSPASLSAEEQALWEEHRAARLFEGAGGARTVDQLFEEIDQLSESADDHGQEVLGALYDYAEMIAPER